MYTWTRIVQFKNVGAMMAAMPVCTAVVDHLKKKYKQDAVLLMPVLGGHPARVLFVIRSEDINSNLAAQQKSSQDAKYRELVGKLGEYVDGSATHDQVWQTVG